MKNTQQLKKELEKKDKEIKELKKLLRESVKWGREAEDMRELQKREILEKIEEEMNNDNFVELTQDITAENWHNSIRYYLEDIKEHEQQNKHIVRQYGLKYKDFSKNGIKYYKYMWICEDCGKIFLKIKFNPEILQMKEFYQMCFYGGLSNLAQTEFEKQILDF